jgi:hypothetical protein
MVPACELCAGPAGSQHSHVIDLESRRLLCTCRPCYLLFTHPGAGAGRFRSVSERYLRINQPALATTHLDALQIPVGIAFFLSNSKLGRVIAFFPSPAGATESGLSLESWREMVDAAPELAAMESDVEALLLCRRGERSISWIVPVDSCYELVGRIRKTWRGFEGGEEAWAEIDSFLAGLEQRETRDAA